MPRTKAVPYLGRKEKLKKSVGFMLVNRSLHHMGVISFQMEEYPALRPVRGTGRSGEGAVSDQLASTALVASSLAASMKL